MNAQHLGHWCEGGNAVTNFDPKQTYIYERAIDEHGDSTLYIGPPTPRGLAHYKALRVRGLLNGCVPQDLSDFWRVFDRVKAEAKATGSTS